MVKLKELYDRLFKSRDLRDYTETITKISEAIEKIENYNPKSLDFYKRDFPDSSCSAYLCISTHDTYGNEYRLWPRRNGSGEILVRHGHWDRDNYIGSLALVSHVAGGPLEVKEYQNKFFPIFTQEHLRIAVAFMVQIHNQNAINFLETDNEGFLDKEK